ncbi:unnamed protein product, partial [Nesidiocoris tenuis]
MFRGDTPGASECNAQQPHLRRHLAACVPTIHRSVPLPHDVLQRIKRIPSCFDSYFYFLCREMNVSTEWIKMQRQHKKVDK